MGIVLPTKYTKLKVHSIKKILHYYIVYRLTSRSYLPYFSLLYLVPDIYISLLKKQLYFDVMQSHEKII